MKFYNLNNPSEAVSFEQAILSGTGSDGGLYFPQDIPIFRAQELRELKGKSFADVAFATLQKWMNTDMPARDLEIIVTEAFNFELPLVQVGEYDVLELFHGPTLAFKDIAARFLAGVMQYYLSKSGKKINIIVATSGDTGGAVASAFGGKANINVFVLYPKGKVSELQRLQLTHVAANVIPIEVVGSFDICQDLVKQVLAHKSFHNFSTANSINIGRLLPQICYYAYVFSQVGTFHAVVPTGNLGNATAGFLAHKMGAGPSGITLATNANPTLARYYKTGAYSPGTTLKTISNAMDVSAPNNFARYLALSGNNWQKFKDFTRVVSVSGQQTIATIKDVYERYNYPLDPHSAVAWHAGQVVSTKQPQVIFATASPLKFAQEIKSSTGIEQSNSNLIDDIKKTPSQQVHTIENSFETLKKLLCSY